MQESRFAFVSNDSLRKNIHATFSHIARLLNIVDDPQYPNEAKSAFCKTIIIHTSSVLEALLFALLDTRYSDEDISVQYATWQMKQYHQLHTIDENTKIVAGTYKRTPSKTTKAKLNLSQIADILKRDDVISSALHQKITKVRSLRNEQHLATQQKLKSYSRKDVAEVFEIAREVVSFVRKSTSQ
jgi:hypothetical protein